MQADGGTVVYFHWNCSDGRVAAALLVVHLGVTRMEDAESTVGIIGKQKFIGAVTIESMR